MQTFSHIQELPLEILELISEKLPAQSYCNLREVCKNTSMLPQIAKLNLKAYQESAKGWKAENEKSFKGLYNVHYFGPRHDGEENKIFTDHVHLIVQQLSPPVFVWMCENYIGEEVMRMIRNDPSILNRLASGDIEKCKTFPLHWACRDDLDVVELLLKVPWIDPSKEDEEGFYALDFASVRKNSQASIVKLLLQHSRVDPSKTGVWTQMA